jgi:hypothetical protein
MNYSPEPVLFVKVWIGYYLLYNSSLLLLKKLTADFINHFLILSPLQKEKFTAKAAKHAKRNLRFTD